MTDLKCPGCGAPLTVKEDTDIVTCSFCSKVIDLGLNGEQAQLRKAKAVAGQIRQYGRNLDRLSALQAEIRDRSEQLEAGRIKRKSFKSSTVVTAVVLWAVLVLIILFWLEDALYRYDFFRVFSEIFLSAAAGTGIGFLSAGRITRRLPEIDTDIRSQEELLRESESTLQSFSASFDVNFLSPALRNKKDLDFLAGVLETGRAYTLHQAIILCEDKKDREAFEQRQQETLQEMRKIQNETKNSNRSAKRKETGSELADVAAAAVGTAVAGKIVKEIFKRL